MVGFEKAKNIRAKTTIAVQSESSLLLLNQSPIEWLDSVMNSKSTQSRPIPRVPQMLHGTKDFEKHYLPRVVSLGPYHFGNTNLETVQNLKLQIAKKFVSGDRNTLIYLYDKVLEISRELDLYTWYEERSIDHMNISIEAFARMMVLDGCFVLYYIECISEAKESQKPSVGDLEMKSQDVSFVQLDLCLLENQLPFCVLKILMEVRPFWKDYMSKINSFIANNIIGYYREPRNENCWSNNLHRLKLFFSLVKQCFMEPSKKTMGQQSGQLNKTVQQSGLSNPVPRQRSLNQSAQQCGPSNQTSQKSGLSNQTPQKSGMANQMAHQSEPSNLVPRSRQLNETDQQWGPSIQTSQQSGPSNQTPQQSGPSNQTAQQSDLSNETACQSEPSNMVPLWQLMNEMDHQWGPSNQTSQQSGSNQTPQQSGSSNQMAQYPVHLLQHLQSMLVGAEKKQPQAKSGSTLRNKDKKHESQGTNNRYTFRNVGELLGVGIHFRPSRNNYLTSIKYVPEKFCTYLELPPITVDDSTRAMFLNLIAYEMCSESPNESWVTSYICFLDSLIDHPDDVKVLRSAGVLHNCLGSDEEVSQLFNDIAYDLVPNLTVYDDVKRQIQKHYNEPTKTWMAQFNHEYFRNPWSIFALLGALIALFLSGVQAYFSVWSSPSDCDELCQYIRKTHHL